MYVELITILVRAKDDITRACRRCQSTLYIVFNIAKVGGPHNVVLKRTVLAWHVRGSIGMIVAQSGKLSEDD